MKRVLLTSLMVFSISLIAFGQLSLRPQVGINFPSFTDEIIHGKFKGNAGFQFGADLQIGSTFYVQPGANFQTKTLDLENVGEIKVSRLNVPVLIGFKLFEPEDSKAFGLRIFGGPNFAFNLNEELGDAFSDISISKDDIKDFQLSAIVGGGLDISLLFIDVGYKLGLTKYFEDTVSTDGAVHLFLVNAGIRIGF